VRGIADTDLTTNPEALPGADPPRIVRVPVNGTTLYTEVRGSGPAVLLIHAGAEDAEGWRPIAERLTGFTVVTYDRRGTLRSGVDDWPGGGSAQHADDAAGLLEALGLGDALMLGYSSSGNITLQLALRHPEVVRRALVYEPGYLRLVPESAELQKRMRNGAAEHLASNPDDWAGAYAALLRAAAMTTDRPPDTRTEAPQSRSWYDAREEGNAKTLLLDDIPILTSETVDEALLALAPANIRFSYGSRTLPAMRQISTRLAEVRGTVPDVIDDIGHFLYYYPETVAGYIRAQVS
jgi:pimeloyl-ACP methyl ester carboxylesterase